MSRPVVRDPAAVPTRRHPLDQPPPRVDPLTARLALVTGVVLMLGALLVIDLLAVLEVIR